MPDICVASGRDSLFNLGASFGLGVILSRLPGIWGPCVSHFCLAFATLVCGRHWVGTDVQAVGKYNVMSTIE